ncbi:phage tail spike protein [Ligilactobacillus salitolerans]|nr:phage tail spike protein [Ligilactobacillus salitolerans]
MYFFNKNEELVQVANNFIEAHLIEQINTASQLTFSLKEPLPSSIVKACIPSPNGDGFLMFKILTEDIKESTIEYTCIESAYDELASYGYIKDLRPSAQQARYMLEMVLQGTRWELGLIYNTSNATTNFYYEPILNCIQDIVSLFGLELTFTVSIEGNKITTRRVNMYYQQGKRTGKRFEYGSNALDVERETSTEELYTALVGRGKGEEVDGDDNSDTPDGYGRRITFADIEWKKSNGDPLDKPKGQEYLEDPDATKAYGFDDGKPRIGLVEFEDDEDKDVLIQHTYQKLQELKRPKVQFKASVIDVGDCTLGDTVAIIRHDFHLEYMTRVFKINHDLLDEHNNTVELGDDLSGNDLTSKVNDISNSINQTNQQISYVMTAADGQHKAAYSPNQPKTAKNGDLWYKDLGNGETELYIFNDGWQLVTSTEHQKEIDDAVDQAMQDIDDAAAKANQAITDAGFATDTATTAKQVANSVKGDVTQAKEDSATALTNAKDALDNAKDAKTTATSVSSKVDEVEGKLVDKADKTTVDSINQTVKQQGTLVEQNAEAIKKTAKQSDVDTLTGRVGTVESSNEQLAGEIKQKVSSSDVQGLLDKGGYATQKWTGSQIDQKADEITHTVTDVSNKVDNLNIGARNYIENSLPTNSDGWNFTSGGTADHRVVDGQYLEITRTGGSYHQINRSYPIDGTGWFADIRPGDVFTISLDVSMTSVPTVDSLFYGSLRLNAGSQYVVQAGIWNLKDIIKVANTWYRVSMVIKAEDAWVYDTSKWTQARLIIESQTGSNTDIIRIRKVKLETGTKATDWTPAPEDLATVTALSKVDQKADSISSTVTNNKSDADNKFTNINQTISGIQSTVASKADASQITQLSNQINLKVSQTDFDNMQVGGRNYVTNGNFADGTNGWTKFGNIDTYQIWGDGRLVYSSTKAINGYTGAGQNNIPISGSKGDNTTVSFDACYFGDNPSNYAKYINIIVHYNDNSGTIVSQSKNSIDMTSSVQRYSFTIKAPTDFSTVNVRFVYDSNTLYRNKLGRVKIEKGTKATDYTDSPDDKADKANLVSQINIDESGVLIQGKKIMIDGDATIKNAVIKSSMIDTLDASKITAGTLNAANVNVINMNANNIVTGTLSGIKIKSADGNGIFSVQGNDLRMQKNNGDNLVFNTNGIFWKNGSGDTLFEVSNKVTTSDIFGTSEYNVYLASNNETRSVTFATAMKGHGSVDDYTYVDHRAHGVYSSFMEVNTGIDGARNVYIRPLKAEDEVRITASGGTDSYANLRARYVFADRIANNNSQTDSVNLYLMTHGEVAVKTTNMDTANSGYMPVRASGFNNGSLAEYKQNICEADFSALDEINKSTIYNYQLKNTPDKDEVGLVIGGGYDISNIVVDGDGVNQYRMTTVAWKAIQELEAKLIELKDEISELKGA